MLSLLKAKIKAHTRRLKSGKVVVVKEHTDSRTKKTAVPRKKVEKDREWDGTYETRSENLKPDQKRNLVKAKDDAIVNVRGLPGTMLGNRMFKGFKDESKTSLLGHKVTSTDDLAIIGQIFRNPSFETNRIIFTRKGEVVGVTGVTSRMPGSSAIFVGANTTIEQGLAQIRRLLEKSGGDSFYLLHNHPSGDPSPSPNDLHLTDVMFEKFKEFKGHTIINHDQYATILPGRKVSIEDIPADIVEKKGRYLGKDKPSIPHLLLGVSLDSSRKLMEIAVKTRETAKAGTFQVIGTNSKGYISGIMEIPMKEVSGKRNSVLLAQARKFMRATASVRLFAVNVPKGDRGVDFVKAVNTGVFTDVINEDGASYRDYGVEKDVEYSEGRKGVYGVRAGEEIRTIRHIRATPHSSKTPAKIYTANVDSPGAFSGGITGRGRGSKAVALINEKGQFGFLPGEDEPYTPLGGRKALQAVLDIVEFKDYEYGERFTVKRGRAMSLLKKSRVKAHARKTHGGKVVMVKEHTTSTTKKAAKPKAGAKIKTGSKVKYKVPDAKYLRSGVVLKVAKKHLEVEGKRDQLTGKKPVHKVPHDEAILLSTYRRARTKKTDPKKTGEGDKTMARNVLSNEEWKNKKVIAENRLGMKESELIMHGAIRGVGLKASADLAKQNGINTNLVDDPHRVLWHRAEDLDYQEVLFNYFYSAMKAWRRELSKPITGKDGEKTKKRISEFKKYLAGKVKSSEIAGIITSEGKRGAIKYLIERREKMQRMMDMDISDMQESPEMRHLLSSSSTKPMQMPYLLAKRGETLQEDTKKVLGKLDKNSRALISVKLGFPPYKEGQRSNAEVANILNGEGITSGGNKWTRNSVGAGLKKVHAKIKTMAEYKNFSEYVDIMVGRDPYSHETFTKSNYDRDQLNKPPLVINGDVLTNAPHNHPVRMGRGKTIAVDFDGVIASYDEGYQGVDVFGQPIPGASETLQALKDEGWRVIIYTVRQDTPALYSYLENNQIPFDYINHNPDSPESTNRGKPLADVYLDDRAIRFTNWQAARLDILRAGAMEKSQQIFRIWHPTDIMPVDFHEAGRFGVEDVVYTVEHKDDMAVITKAVNDLGSPISISFDTLIEFAENERLKKSMADDVEFGQVVDTEKFIAIILPVGIELSKSFSSNLQKKYAGGRWITVKQGPLAGRHIFILPHEDGSATVLAGGGPAMRHKLLQVRKEKEGEKHKEVEQAAKKEEKKEPELTEEERLKLTSQKKVIREHIVEKRQEMADIVKEKLGKEVGMTDKDKADIEKRIAKIVDPHQKKVERAKETRRVKAEKDETMQEIMKQVRSSILNENPSVQNMKGIAAAVKEAAEELAAKHYEIQAFRREHKVISKAINLGKSRDKFSAGTIIPATYKRLTSDQIQEAMAKEKALEQELDAHYKLIRTTRGIAGRGKIKGGKEIERNHFMEMADRVRKFGLGSDNLMEWAQANGTALKYLGKAYEAYGQAEGALNQGAELVYALKNDVNALEFRGNSPSAIERKRKSLKLLKGDVRITKESTGNYKMVVPPKAFEKLIAERPSEKHGRGLGFEFSSSEIKDLKANTDDFRPSAIREYLSENKKGISVKIVPKPEQQASARFIAQQKRVYLNHEAGTGKSLSVLLAKAHIEDTTGKPLKTIISMPSKLMPNFKDEVKKFTNFNVVIASSQNKKKRIEAYNSDPNTIVLVNKEKFNFDKIPIAEAGFNMVVADEAHKITQREGRGSSMMSGGLQDIAKQAEYYVAMSGTPTPSDLSELYFHAHVIDPKKFNNQKEFMAQFGSAHKGVGYKKQIAEFMNTQLNDNVYTVKKTLSTKFNLHRHEVKLSGAQQKAYKEASAAYLRRDINPLQRDQQYNNILNGFDHNQNSKFKQIKSIVDDHLKKKSADEKVLFYAKNRNTVNEIKSFLKENYPEYGHVEFTGTTKVKDLKGNKQKFKTDPKVKFSIHMRAGVEGLNLQYDGNGQGATTAIAVASGEDSYAPLDQFFSRANRTGAVKDIDGHLILTDTPHDIGTQVRLEEKQEVGELIQDKKIGVKKSMGDGMLLIKGGMSDAQKEKVSKVMAEFKAGKLRTSSGDKVTDYKQALAIALSQAREIRKSRVKAYARKTKSGQVVMVREHTDSRIKNSKRRMDDLQKRLAGIKSGTNKEDEGKLRKLIAGQEKIHKKLTAGSGDGKKLTAHIGKYKTKSDKEYIFTRFYSSTENAKKDFAKVFKHEFGEGTVTSVKDTGMDARAYARHSKNETVKRHEKK
jgi:hypothetical protein